MGRAPELEKPPVSSILKKIGGAIGTIGKIAVGAATGGPIGAVAAIGSSLIKSPAAPIPKAGPSLPATLPSFLPGVPQVIGGIAGGVGGALVGQLTGKSGCGCNGRNGRDPCTGQVMSAQKAPLATLFGGCCPPGRVLRRISMGRDICIRKPRMNPFNPRALARADRRITQFTRRSAAILRDMGFQVSKRKPIALKGKARGRRRARG